jgi:cell division protease FtsH
MDRHQKEKWRFSLIYLVIAALAMYSFQMLLVAPQPKEVSYSEFLEVVRAGRLAEVNITERQFIGLPKREASKGKPVLLVATRLPGIDESPLVRELEAQKVKISGRIQVRPWWVEFLLSWILPLAVLSVIYAYGMWRVGQSSGPLSLGRNRAKIYDESSRIEVTFADVAGVDEARNELMEIVDFLKNPAKYQKLGGRIPKGVLLVGPPGTGKTLLARAVAGEAGVPFFSISGSEFVEMFVGLGAARVRDLFEQAKQKAPCIVFIDELDALGRARAAGGVVFSHSEQEQTLNQLLVEMDGFDSSKGVIIMAATNRPEILDPALLRAGRFDRHIVVDRPDLKGRLEILKVHARKVKLAPDVNLETVAARTPGMVGADLANIMNEAALLAARRGAEQVEMRDLEEAIDRVLLGLEKKNRCLSREEKQRVAYHEVGHALVALSVPNADPVHRISIIPRTIGALGHTLQLPTQEKYLLTRPELEDRVAVLLGGRAAEDIVYNGVVSTGAADDLERATELVRQMVTRFGMSPELGLLTYGRVHAARFLGDAFAPEERNYSERTAEQIDAEVRRVMDASYKRVKKILLERREEMDRIAEQLIRKESLDRAEIEALLAKAPAPQQ